MKKIIFSMLVIITIPSISFGQKKSYLCVEGGGSFSFAGNQVVNAMKANGFGDNYDYYAWPIANTGRTQYPEKRDTRSIYRFRYGYFIKENSAIEIGYGPSFANRTDGVDTIGDELNYYGGINRISISYNISTAYMAYVWRNKKETIAVGAGPAVSFYTIKQGEFLQMPASAKKYVLPGAAITGSWNFLNYKNWFLGVRTDLTITSPAKTEEVKVVNFWDDNFVSTSRSFKIGGLTGSLLLSAGIRF